MPRASRFGRTPAVLGLAALAFGSLAACSSSSGDDAGDDTPQTITILSSWTSGNATGDQFTKDLEAFTEETGIQVDVEEVNNDDVDKTFEASSLAGEESDLVILNLTPDSADWLRDGLVVDVAQYVDEWGISDTVVPDALDYWTNENGVNGFPFIGFNWPIWYNTELLAQAGVDEVPATFDDLIAAATKLRAAGIQPFALGGKDWTAGNFITWLGQQYVEPDAMADVFSEGTWCDPDVVKGLDLLTTMRDEGVFVDNVAGYDGDQMTNAFFTGQAAMMPSGSWAYTNVPEEVAAVTQLAGFPLPADGAYAKPTAFQGHSAGFFLTPNGAEKIDEVQQLIEYIYSPEVLKGWVSEANQILDVKPDVVAGAESSAPLVMLGTQLGNEADFLLLPDSYLPENTDFSTVASEFLGQSGTTGADLCVKLEAEYED